MHSQGWSRWINGIYQLQGSSQQSCRVAGGFRMAFPGWNFEDGISRMGFSG